VSDVGKNNIRKIETLLKLQRNGTLEFFNRLFSEFLMFQPYTLP
jgi:hypothetical protein